MIMVEVMKGFIDQQIATYQEGHVRTFMDLYIKEMKDAELKGEKTDFTYDQMIMMCTDFLLPALSSSEAQVGFLLRLLVHNQSVLRKIQDEIENVVGSGRLPGLDDRIK